MVVDKPLTVAVIRAGIVGLLQAPTTARLVAALLTGTPPPFEPAPFAARRCT